MVLCRRVRIDLSLNFLIPGGVRMRRFKIIKTATMPQHSNFSGRWQTRTLRDCHLLKLRDNRIKAFHLQVASEVHFLWADVAG